MKRLILIAVLLTIALGVWAQSPVYRDTAIAEWDAPVSPVLLTGESWEYDVYLCDRQLGDPAVVPLSSMVYMGRALTTTLTMDMTTIERQEYWLVVQAFLHRADDVLDPHGVADSLHHADPTMAPLGWYYIPEEGVQGAPGRLRDAGT